MDTGGNKNPINHDPPHQHPPHPYPRYPRPPSASCPFAAIAVISTAVIAASCTCPRLPAPPTDTMRAAAVLRNAAKAGANAAKTPKPMSNDHTLYHLAPTVGVCTSPPADPRDSGRSSATQSSSTPRSRPVCPSQTRTATRPPGPAQSATQRLRPRPRTSPSTSTTTATRAGHIPRPPSSPRRTFQSCSSSPLRSRRFLPERRPSQRPRRRR